MQPLLYHHRVSRARCYTVLAATWLLIVATTAGLGLAGITPDRGLWRCCGPAPARTSPGPALALAAFLLPTALLAVLYTRIYLAAHNSSERTRKCSLKPADCSVVLEAGPRSSLASLPGPVRQLLAREEGRAAWIYLLSLGSTVLCWAPLATARLLPDLLPAPAPLLLAASYSLISTGVTAAANRKIQTEVGRLVRCGESGGMGGTGGPGGQRLSLELPAPHSVLSLPSTDCSARSSFSSTATAATRLSCPPPAPPARPASTCKATESNLGQTGHGSALHGRST